KEISDHTIHDASIYQDKNATSIAVVIYSLAKIFDKHKYKEYENWNEFYMKCTKHLEKARESLIMEHISRYHREIKTLYKLISEIEKELGMFITEVLKQAEIKKASRIYEHGISIGRTAELLGISPWDLMTYVGQTKIPEMGPEEVKTIKERLEFTKKLFS
ncbi:MAG: hypothetical protein QXR60_03295, partial [Candidatus Nanoarchaeia archaeon]